MIAVVQRVLRAQVTVGETAAQAQNGADTQLDYGRMPKGDSATRYISVKNKGAHSVYIRLVETGSIAGIMRAGQSGFTLRPGEERQVELTVSIPKETGKGGYSGTVLLFKAPRIF
jgi:hypothetical protein